MVGLVRVEVGQARQRQDLARHTVEHEAARTLGMKALHGRAQLARHRLLDPEVEAERHRLAVPMIAQRAVVERIFDARQATIVDVDEAQRLARETAVRVDAMLGRAEADARDAQLEDGLLLLGRDLVLDPGEPPRGGEATRQLAGVDVAEDVGQLARGQSRVRHERGIAVDRRHQQVGRQDDPVTIGDVRPRMGCRGDAARGRHRLRRRDGGGSRDGGRRHHVHEADGDAEEAQEEHATHDAETPPSRQHRAVRLASISGHLADHGLASSAGGTAGGRGFTASCT